MVTRPIIDGAEAGGDPGRDAVNPVNR